MVVIKPKTVSIEPRFGHHTLFRYDNTIFVLKKIRIYSPAIMRGSVDIKIPF